MAQEKDSAAGIVVGGIGGTAFGTVLGMLLASKPAEAAPPEAKWDYLVQCQEAIIVLLQGMADSNAAIISLLQQLVAAAGIPAEGVEVTVQTKWVAKLPEQIFYQPIRDATATFYCDKMVDWTEGKRLHLKVESTLDQAVNVQVIGNTVDDTHLATDVGDPYACPANGNISIGLAWDDWNPLSASG